MKKILALVLCLMMAFSMTSVFAEEETAVLPAEELFEGVWVQFEDGFEFYLPADWVEYECTEEMNAEGIFYMAGTEDMAYSCTLAWQPLEMEQTIEEVQTALAAVYADAKVVEVNGVALVAYVDVENSLLNCVALDATEPGFYLFAFSPAEDEDFQMVASLIASTIRNME